MRNVCLYAREEKALVVLRLDVSSGGSGWVSRVCLVENHPLCHQWDVGGRGHENIQSDWGTELYLNSFTFGLCLVFLDVV